MRLIAINALQVGNRSGTGYYSQKIVEHVPAVGRQFDYLVILPGSFEANPLCARLAQMPNVRLVFEGGGCHVKRVAYEQLVLPRLIHKFRAQLLHSLAFVSPLCLRARSVVTVHDLAHKLFPDAFTPFRRAYLDRATQWSVRSAARVIAVSHSVKADIVRHLLVEPARVTVAHEGGFEAATLAPRIRRRYLTKLLGWDGEYVLFLGTLEPRKNLERLLVAFELVRQRCAQPYKLVVVGRKGWLTNGIRRTLDKRRVAEDLIFTDFLPSSVVMCLMQEASAFVMPSLYEGFGLPLVTAMACGTPIAASNAGSIPEVVGDAGLLFDPLDTEEMAEALHQLLTSPELREQLVEAGKRRAGQFSWDKCAQKTVAVYEEALSA